MVASSTLLVILHSLVLCTQGLEQQCNGGDTMASSLLSFISSLEKRLAALEAGCGNSMEERLSRLEAEVTRLQQKVSAQNKSLQDNDLSGGSIVHHMTALVAASEQSFQSTMQNATEILASMMNDTKTQLLALVDTNTALVNTSINRVEQTIKDLATYKSALEEKLDNATLSHAEEMKNIRMKCEDRQTEANCTQRYRRTCQDYYDHGQKSSGTYKLLLETTQSPMEVYCDMSNGTGWVVFQRRQDGSVDFYRNWTSYENGFGDLNGEFWLGNRNIHRLTSAGLTQLRVDLQAWNGSTAIALYSNFTVGDASSSYTMSVSGYSGTAGDSLARHNRHKFTTLDRDQDTMGGNCAQYRKGAWWYANCTDSNLNGLYGTRDSNGDQYVTWYHWLGTQSLQRTELKLK